MSEWKELGVFQADNARRWQTFETAQCWIRYLRVEFDSTYFAVDTHFLTITQVRYSLSS